MAAVVLMNPAVGLMPHDGATPDFETLLAATIYADWLNNGAGNLLKADGDYLERASRAAFDAAEAFCSEHQRRKG